MALASPWIAGLVALLAWWASTGAILVAVRRADATGRHGLVTWGTLPLLAAGLWGIHATAAQADVAAAYGATLSALAVWGWIELAFLTGTITGPAPHPARAGVPEWERFVRAWGTVAYHEIALTVGLGAVWALTADAANPFGFWTFAVLWAARISAKLNLYLGVAKVNVEFIPRPLTHLPSHFREARMNWLFPTSVTALSFAAACWAERVAGAGTAFEAVGFALLTALTGLALLEHWFMVVRLPDEKLWRWMLPANDTKTTPTGEDAHAVR
ncbi:DUF3623 domain-containing protein [Jannaschia sp. Os4]|uniref:putative photosynthetic complex assembly protein PuhE n=1 Tax=Jannaschia sp. Os4 TaxID=2807617 RepID=UPI00193A368D|nr:putative photosynthetic complex assembly protein PuhE [Jannaschia sp. Os4]MBM2575499.1 DUF3623 domain-containing protein [Jannaschia sp. Os4]